MNKWAELFLGLILVVGSVYVAWASSTYSWSLMGKSLNFLGSGWIFLQGGLFWFAIMIGALFIILGISDLKN